MIGVPIKQKSTCCCGTFRKEGATVIFAKGE